MALLEPITLSGVTPEPVTLRAGRPDDAPGILDLRRAVATECPFMIAEPGEIAVSPRGLCRKLAAWEADAATLCLVACAQGRIVGLSLLRGARRRRVAHNATLTLMVSLSHRGLGIGGALLDASLAWASAHPTIAIVSLTAASDNRPAIGLYRTRGFEIEGTRRARLRLSRTRFADVHLMARLVKTISVACQ
ncbi:MAG: GNAT family N-acetyltransferase [Phycisphaerales bacterium]|nr:GNAT family N-acetyltransferase [Phycisphaerales bacterium]